jgi:hypothetical protein
MNLITLARANASNEDLIVNYALQNSNLAWFSYHDLCSHVSVYLMLMLYLPVYLSSCICIYI